MKHSYSSLYRKFGFHFAFLVVALIALTLRTQAVVVYSNNDSPGDSFTNPSGSNQGQAIGTTGWVYNNVRASGEVGISTDYPKDGNGSVAFHVPTGSKADIEYLSDPVDVLGNFYASSSLGLLSDLTGLSYDWYRASSSTAAGHFMPSLRLIIDADGDLNTIGDRGGLVYEAIYNGQAVAPLDTWVHTDVFGDDANMWSFGLGISTAANGYDVNLSEWQDGVTTGFINLVTANAVVLGFSSGIGSGWNGTFDGAVDNISWQFANETAVSANFEVKEPLMTPVPEVGTVAAASVLGVLVLGTVFRSRKKDQDLSEAA